MFVRTVRRNKLLIKKEKSTLAFHTGLGVLFTQRMAIRYSPRSENDSALEVIWKAI